MVQKYSEKATSPKKNEKKEETETKKNADSGKAVSYAVVFCFFPIGNCLYFRSRIFPLETIFVPHVNKTKQNNTITRTEQQQSISKKNQNAPRPSEHPPVGGGGMSKRLVGGIKGCKYKTSSWK